MKRITTTFLLSILSILCISAQSIQYSGTIKDAYNKPINKARIYAEAGRTDANGCFKIETKYGRAILVAADGYTDHKVSLYSDPTYCIKLDKIGSKTDDIIPQALKTDFEKPLYIVNGIYIDKFKANNYTDSQILSATTIKKWNKEVKKVFADTNIDKIDVEKRGVVMVTLADGVTLNSKDSKGKYTIVVTDSHGNPIPDAIIYTGRDRSDENGAFSFKAKPNRRVIVEASAKYVSKHFTLTENSNLDIVLQKNEAYPQNVNIMPAFRGGGIQNFREWIMEYMSAELMGTRTYYDIEIHARFIVGTSGKVVSVDIIKENHKKIAYSVKKAIYDSPKWTPGLQYGKKVSVSYVIPIKIRANM